MYKLYLLLLIAILLTVACRSNSDSWEPNSETPPQFDKQLRLLVQLQNNQNSLTKLNIDEGRLDERTISQESSLDLILNGAYQVVGNRLIGQNDRSVTLPALTAGTIAPNGLWLTSGQDGLQLLRIDGIQMLLSSSGRFPVWSVDSQWLAYQDDTGLWAVDMRTLETQKLSNRDDIEPLAYSADNQKLLLRAEKTALIFDVVTQSETTLGGVDASQIHDLPIWSPDGQTIYARYGNKGRTDAFPQLVQARLVAIDINKSRRNMRDLLPNVRNRGITSFVFSPDRTVVVVRHWVCGTEIGKLIPIPTRKCDRNQLLLVESATGNYQRLPSMSPTKAIAWEQTLSPVSLTDLPSPSTSAVAAPPADASFWFPSAATGHNPATAIPFGQVQNKGVGSALLSVESVIFGEEARALALNVPGSPPLLDGYTFVAIRQRITRESGKSSLYLTPRTLLVDDQLAAHEETLWLNAEGEAIKELAYSAEEPAEYWQLFAIQSDAQPLFLFASAGVSDNLPDLYFRLDDNAAWPKPETADPLPVNTIGVTEPAEVGETAVSANWQITLLDNDSTEMSDIIKIRIAYTGAPASANRLFTCLSQKNFEGIAGTFLGGTFIYEIYAFQNFAYQPCLLPGGVFEGWISAFPESAGDPITIRFVAPKSQNDPFADRSFVIRR